MKAWTGSGEEDSHDDETMMTTASDDDERRPPTTTTTTTDSMREHSYCPCSRLAALPSKYDEVRFAPDWPVKCEF